MGEKLAIDFGTTNTVVARWNPTTNQSEIVNLVGLSDANHVERIPVIPSLVYVQNASTNQTIIGVGVRQNELEKKQDNRLFRNFKRGIVAQPAPAPRIIDGTAYADVDAGSAFVRQVLSRLPYAIEDIEQLILTAPVASFESYLSWLNYVVETIPSDKIRIIDESTAAALGYAVTKPGAAVMVFDFGGGTLDLSLVQLPESGEKVGGFLNRLLRSNANQHSAKVIAKAGRIIGGSDIDQWLLAHVLQKTNITPQSLGNDYANVLTLCEHAKIRLSSEEETLLTFRVGKQQYELFLTRNELETVLEANGFFTALRNVVDKVMHIARQRGIFKEDIQHVLMVGGSSLMPSVQRTLQTYFTATAVKADKPFTAVAEGALQVAAGYGLDDYLIHGYGIRNLDEETGEHTYDEIIPMGSRYPTENPIEVLLGAAHDQQTEMEFIIGEIDTDAISMLEVTYEDGQAVFVAQAGTTGEQIVPLNQADVLKSLARLTPSATAGMVRVKASFSIDDKRLLRLTARDIQTNQILVDDVVLAALR